MQLLLESLLEVSKIGKKIVFVWVPGHVGIPGNEKADVAANLATLSTIISEPRVRPHDPKKFFHKTITEQWLHQWISNESKLLEIKRTVEAWRPPVTLTRREFSEIGRAHV